MLWLTWTPGICSIHHKVGGRWKSRWKSPGESSWEWLLPKAKAVDRKWSGGFSLLECLYEVLLEKYFLCGELTLPYLPFLQFGPYFQRTEKNCTLGPITGNCLSLPHALGLVTVTTPISWPSVWPWCQGLPFSWLISEILWLLSHLL